MKEYMLNISPIDGRYEKMTEEVKKYFSEYNLIKNRVIVEIEWLKKLFSIKELGLQITKEELETIDKISKNFDVIRSRASKRNRRNNKT